MERLIFNYDRALPFISSEEVEGMKSEMDAHNRSLEQKSGKGNDFLGWLHLPSSVTESQIAEIETAAENLRAKKIDLLIVIGIGGSYLGTKAVVDALSDSFPGLKPQENPLIIFAGQNIGEDYMSELLELLENKDYALVVISKSGTTTEPAIAFRILKLHLEEKYGKEDAGKRIIAITDPSEGALRKLACCKGYKTFIIPGDVGGRYSVLSPVGLLPIAVAGFNIRELIKGAADMEAASGTDVPFESNSAAKYAAVRNLLYRNGYLIEILVNFHPKLHYFGEWWKQLYGESEGKEGKGLFPASVDFTTDLHSMGQYIQEGVRKLFETVISVKTPCKTVEVPYEKENPDELNFLSGKRMDEVNKMAELGTAIAHVDGGVPNLRIEIPALNEYYLGQLIYFFEIACGMSGYALGINPFDQPGVEAYKKNMFALLEKPGFEAQTMAIRAKIV